MHITSKRVTYLYEVMDSAYDDDAIRKASIQLNHQPIIQPHTRPKPKTQLPVHVRGPQKVFAHLMFGVLALTVDRLLKIHT